MSDIDVEMQDFADILNALGLGDHARPISRHEIVQTEILPAIRRLSAVRWTDDSKNRMYWTKDGPVPIEPMTISADKQEGDAKEVWLSNRTRQLQAQGPDEYPEGYYRHVAESELAGAEPESIQSYMEIR